jgi:hypothetical protein
MAQISAMTLSIVLLGLVPATARAQELSPNCQTTLDNLNRQEDRMKQVMANPGPEARLEAAKTMGFYRATQVLLPSVCQGQIVTEMDTRLTTSITTLQEFIDNPPVAAPVMPRRGPRVARPSPASGDRSLAEQPPRGAGNYERFVAFCRSRGSQSWMRFNGVTHYCPQR